MKICDQGINPKRFLVSPRTLIFLFDDDERVLLIKGSPQKERWAGYFNGIGGHVEANEDILTAAQRELSEEAGLSNVEIQLCGQIMISESDKSGVALFLFRGKYDQDNTLSSDEGELEWIPLDQIQNYPVVDDLEILLPLVAKYEKKDPIIIGKYTFDRSGELQISFAKQKLIKD